MRHVSVGNYFETASVKNGNGNLIKVSTGESLLLLNIDECVLL